MAGRNNPEETRQEILSETLKLLSGSNYSAISTGMIARACGITKPAIYYHFKNKEDLFTQLVGYLLQRINEVIEGSRDKNRTVKEQLTVMCATLFSLAEENPHVVGGYLTMMADATIRELSPDFRTSFKSVHRSIREIIEGGTASGELKKGTDPDLAARMFHSTVLGLLESLVLDSTVPLPDPDLLVKMLMEGISGEMTK